MAPLTALTSQMKESPCDDSEFNWWEKGLSAQRVLLGAAFVTATTTVTVAAAGSTSSGAKAIPVGAVLMVVAFVLLSEFTKAWLLYLGLIFMFMVMYAEFLSRGQEEFTFCQDNMLYLRRRVTWEVAKAQFLV